jgi:hypothetical protein
MNKEDWKAFLRWLESASDEEIEATILRIEATSASFMEDGPKMDAKALIKALRLELEARRAIR